MTPALDLSLCVAPGWIITPDFGLRAAAVAGVLGLVSWLGAQRHFAGRPALLWMLAAVALWLLASTFERAAGAAPCKSALALLSWPLILAVPVTWLLFVQQYLRSEHRPPSPRWWWTQAAPLVVFALLIFGNGWLGLMYGPDTRAGEPVLGSPQMHYDRGPVFWLAVSWGYALLITATAQLLRALFTSQGDDRLRSAGVLAVSAVPIVTNLGYLAFGLRLFGADPTPLSFAAAGAGLAWLIRHWQLFDVVPMARRLLFTELPDPVFVLDARLRVMEANVAARTLAGTPPPIGTPLAHWPRCGAALAQRLTATDAVASTPLTLSAPDAVYEVQVRAIGSGEGNIGSLVQLHDVTARQQAHAQTLQTLAERNAELNEAAVTQALLREQAMRDPLTGLLNRRALDERFAQDALYAETHGQVLSLVLLDVDHFKRINDTHGHGRGDAVLRDFAAALRTGLRASDAVFRIGGEEFALLLPGADAPQAARRLQALRERLRDRQLGALSEAVTFSAGVSSTEDHGRTLGELMGSADKALYQAKTQGRNRTVVAPAVGPGDGPGLP